MNRYGIELKNQTIDHPIATDFWNDIRIPDAFIWNSHTNHWFNVLKICDNYYYLDCLARGPKIIKSIISK